MINKISDRRKYRNTISNPNNDQDGILLRMTTNASMINTAPPSIQQFRKIIRELQQTALKQKQKRMEVEDNLKSYQQRAMKREKQFYAIIQESNKSVRSYLKQDGKGGPTNEIKKVYEQIFKNFEETNQATNNLIQRKYKQNLQAMQRKIQNIMQVHNEQITKNKKMSNDTFHEIKNQIQKALSMVKGVQNQNVNLRINLRKEQQKNRLMAEQRKLLIEEMVNKKLIMNKLLQQNKKYKNIIQGYKSASMNINERASKSLSKYSEKEDKQIKTNQKTSMRKFKTLSSTMNNIQQKSVVKHNFLGQELFTQNNTRQQSIQGRKQKKSRISSVSFSPSQAQSQTQQKLNLKNAKTLFKNNLASNTNNFGTHKNQIKFMNQSKRYVSKKQFFDKSFDLTEDDKSMYLVTQQKNNNQEVCPEIQNLHNSSEKTIKHLKSCLERQKKKVNELGKIVTKIQNRNEQVNQVIMEALNAAQYRNWQNGGGNIQNLLKCQKLLQVIVDMRKRLAMFQKPTLNCGWGSLNLQQFMQQILQQKDVPKSLHYK